MTLVALLLPCLALLTLAAHFLRQGDLGLTVGLAGLALALFSRRATVRVAAALTLCAGLAVWADTGAEFVRLRIAMGHPWLRLVAIMGGVMAFTAASAALLLAGPGRRALPRRPEGAAAKGVVFGLVLAGLYLARVKAGLPVLLLDRFGLSLGGLEIFLAAAYGAWACGLLLDPGGSRRNRPRLWLAFSAVFFLQLLLGLAGVGEMLMTGRLHLPVPALIVSGPLYRGGGYFMPILYGVSLLLVGPAWCSHLCYIGAWDDALSRRRKGPPRPNPAWAYRLRAAFLAAAVAVPLLLRALGAPTSLALALAVGFGVAGVGVMALASTRQGTMVHCTTWCPIGLVGNVLGRVNPWRIRIGPGCTGCGKCGRACRYDALRPEHIARKRPGSTCTLCGDCVSACRDQSIGYRFPGLSPTTARTAFVVLVAALHAVFLFTARI